MASQYLRIDVKDADWRLHVLAITLVVHTEGRWESSRFSNNHVTQYLSIQGGRSVQINMRHVNDEVSEGRFEMVSRDYAATATQSLITNIELLISGQPTVQDIYTLLVGGQDARESAGMQDFCFAPGGLGCRYWHITAMCSFESQNFVAHGSALRLFDFLSYQYSRRPREHRPTLVQPGTFDEPRIQQLADRLWQQLLQSAATRVSALQSHADTVGYITQYWTQLITNWSTTPGHIRSEAQRLQSQGIDLGAPSQAASYLTQASAQVTAASQAQRAIVVIVATSARLVQQRAEEEESDEDD